MEDRSPTDGAALNANNLAYVEILLEKFRNDPESVPEKWRDELHRVLSAESQDTRDRWKPRPSFPERSLFHGAKNGRNGARRVDFAILQDRLDQLVRAYRVYGHRWATLSPLHPTPACPDVLRPSFYQLGENEYDLRFSSDTIPGVEKRTLREILAHLRATYCRSIGVEYMHIDDRHVRNWLRDRMEVSANRLDLSRRDQVRIFSRLTDAIVFEEFVQTKFVGAKRFSLEGAESLIPLLDLAIEAAGAQGTDEIVLAMAHRGRLNVLVNVLGKSPQEIFTEFTDASPELNIGRGDVKYHMGYSAQRTLISSGRRINLSLCFNPSHLEFVNPVAMGRARAKQDRVSDTDRKRALTLMIHGDAAFAGEGVTQETLNLSELSAYETGGSIHVIVNNQIGFTTNPEESRSDHYATAVARMLQCPIFHVNGEDPEAVAQVVRLALEFRAEFQRDVVIDMYCYRRRGHNEGDEPSFTQPLMYKIIDERPPVMDSYLETLVELGGMTREESERIENESRMRLETALLQVQEEPVGQREPDSLHGIWTGFFGGPDRLVPETRTAIRMERAEDLLAKLVATPEGFNVHPRLKRLVTSRHEMARGERPLDWGSAELLAFASLSIHGHRVRLSGQDCERGTFSQRHSVFHDAETGAEYRPLSHLAEDQAPVEIYNSPLSEIAVLGFEYGYSLDTPDGLIVWEAQFGDFTNVAQVMIDQFIASAEDKWNRLSGLVMLLPHG
ncbi:MAG: 2-oxoglutarate dehydrogenase E1 component, partial [Planctomycetota bacterium]